MNVLTLHHFKKGDQLWVLLACGHCKKVRRTALWDTSGLSTCKEKHNLGDEELMRHCAACGGPKSPRNPYPSPFCMKCLMTKSVEELEVEADAPRRKKA